MQPPLLIDYLMAAHAYDIGFGKGAVRACDPATDAPLIQSRLLPLAQSDDYADGIPVTVHLVGRQKRVG